MANKKFKKVTEGLHPIIDWAPFWMFMAIWNYAIWGFENSNWLLYTFGLIGACLSILVGKEASENREVHWEEVK